MKKYSFILLLLFAFSMSHAEVQNDIREINNKIANLEGQKDNIKTQFESLENRNKDQWTLMKDSNDMKITDLKNRYEWFWGFLILIVTLSGGGLWTIFTNMKKYFDEMFKEKMSKIFDDEKDKLMQLIQNQDVEAMLKKDKKLLFLSMNTGDETTIKKYVKQLDFSKVEYKVINSTFNYSTLNSNNIIVLNQGSNNFDEPILQKILTNVKEYETLIVSFSKNRIQIFEKYPNINFANSEFTLYARIMETLKIQYIITKSKNK